MSKIADIQKLLTSGAISCRELTLSYLDAIEKQNSILNAFITVTPETALLTADAVDKKLKAGEALLPLEGVPMALKDNLSTAGIKTTCASRALSNYIPIYDAFVWSLLYRQNAPLLGKCNMDEFAMGSTCETSFFGGAKNPHDLTRVAGGSSGGSASAVASNLAPYALGSDTGGSIRGPASFCGLVGLKPTYGTVSRNGAVAYASSLDQIGPITTCIQDAAAVFDVISERDENDMTCVGASEKTLPLLGRPLNGTKIGIADEFFEDVNPDVCQAVQNASRTLQKLGAELVPVSFPMLKYALPVYYILADAEASSNLGRFDGIRYGPAADSYDDINDMICKTRDMVFGKEVQRRILLGTYVLSAGYFDAYYKKAQMIREAMTRQMKNDIFKKCDMLLTPTDPVTAMPFGTNMSPVETYQKDICTVTANITGLPALSAPCGYDGANLPIGMQLIGKPFCEADILNAFYLFEKETDGAFLTNLEMGYRL